MLDCQLHGHLPSPWRPSECGHCNPAPSSQTPLSHTGLLPAIGTTPATEKFLSEALVNLRSELRESRDEARLLAATVERLETQLSDLRKENRRCRRENKGLTQQLSDSRQECLAIIESMNEANAKAKKEDA